MISDRELLEKAKEASKHAYCPYSEFPVGACALFDSGNFYLGCNVENSSYGLTLCAERNAISNAVAQGETSKLVKIAIYSPKSTKCFPCGACRQWIQEFSQDGKTQVILEDENLKEIIYSINDIFPYSFKLI